MVTVTKMVGVVIVIIGGFVRLGQGHVESFKTGFNRLEFLDPIGPASIGLIAFNGLWNYDGWNQLNFVAEEIKVGTYNSNNEFTFDFIILLVSGSNEESSSLHLDQHAHRGHCVRPHEHLLPVRHVGPGALRVRRRGCGKKNVSRKETYF